MRNSPDQHSDFEPRRQLLEDDIPPIKRGAQRPVLVIVSAVILFLLLVIVILNIDASLDQQQAADDREVIELITPRGMDDPNLASDALELRQQFQPQLPRGGWIQITDPQTHEVRQRYRCDRLDPLPDGWLRMEGPEMQIMLRNNRLVTLKGDTANAYAPHNAIESGRITGNVLVKLFERSEGREVNPLRDKPIMVVTTDEAEFDNFLGEIRCDGEVRITTPRLDLPGRKLSLLYDDQYNRIQLRIQQYDYIRLIDEQNTESVVRAQPAQSAVMRPDRRNAGMRIVPASYQVTRAAAASSVSKSSDAPFYLLTLRDNLRIDQGDAASRRVARGDRLEIVFSTESQGFDDAVSGDLPLRAIPIAQRREPQLRHVVSTSPVPLVERIATLIPATLPTTDSIEHLMGPHVTLIRGDGPLTIVPLADDDPRRPASAEDTYLEMIGEPVVLEDIAGDSEAIGHILTFNSGLREVELVGSDQHPLLMRSPEILAGGERFRFNDVRREGGFNGAGWMISQGEPGGRVARPAPPAAPDEEPEVQITWEEGMDLHFDEESGDGRIREALFRGNVRVATQQGVTLNAREVTVGFPDGAADSRQIDRIHARGDVRVLGAGTQGSILCDDLDLALAQSATGETVPTLMVARGAVEAIEDDHIIWADHLRVTFMERERTQAPDDGQRSDEADGRRRSIDVRKLLAEDDVQILLADGTRAFADRMEGDGMRETLELSGREVHIVSDNLIVDRGTRFVLDRKTGKASIPGAGQLRTFRQIILEPQRERLDRPTIDESVLGKELEVRWEEEMEYDSTFNDGAGAAVFRGDVAAEANPSLRERSTLTGQSLTLEFSFAENGDRADVPDLDEPPFGAGQGRRTLGLLIARQEAKIESHTWQDDSQDGEPRIFYVAGQHVEYSPPDGEALVVGDGELLIHDVWEDGAGPDAAVPFGARGSTMMTWKRQLRLTREVDNVHQLFADGEISLRHRALDGAVSWMTCETLEATVVREIDEALNTDQRGEFDFGGSTRLQRVKGSGGVSVHTEQRDIACDVFDYDVRSGVARASSQPPGVVAIQTRGGPGVTQAEEIIWNMERDTIRISRAVGASPR